MTAYQQLHLSQDSDTAPASPKSGEIVRFPKAKLPPQVVPFHKAAARLLEMAFPGPSRHAIACRAAQETGAGVNTMERILAGETSRFDAGLLFAVLAIYQTRTGKAFPIGGGFEIAITQRGPE